MLKHMKQSNLLTFLLIPIAVASIGIVNISAADAAGEKDAAEVTKDAGATGTKTKSVSGASSEKKDKVTADEKVSTGANEEKAPAIKSAPSEKAPAVEKFDNTLGWIGLVLSGLNIIGLGVTFWLNKEAVTRIKDKVRNSDQSIGKLKSQYQPLDHQIKKVDNDYQNYSNKTNKELERLRQSVEEVSRKAASMQQSATTPQSNYRSERQSSSPERYSAPPVNIELSPTEYYNNGQNDFQHKYQITAVGREAENLNQSRAAQTDSVVLAGDRQGNYWLFSDNTETYLVPKQNLKITDNRISTTRDLFECQDYNEYNYNSFVLVEPAVLVSQGNGNWRLKEKGKLQFG